MRGPIFGFERADLGPDRAALRPERADLRPERSGGGDAQMNEQTHEQMDKSPRVLQNFVLFRAATQKEQGQIHSHQSRVQPGRGSD